MLSVKQRYYLAAYRSVVGCRMKAMLPICAALLCGCTTTVTHPSKNQQEMRVDIDLCTEAATTKYWYDAVTALYEAYGCLEEKGYKRTAHGWSEQVEQAMGERRAKSSEPNRPCVVPCKR